jgi:YegS/Rv2252/BmrU family lipid kinase
MLTGVHNAVIIYNPISGRGRGGRRGRLEQARQILQDAGIEAELQPTGAPGRATELARQAVAEGRELVIVVGGDGTINEAVNGLAGSQVPLALLPAGTANVVAKELSIPDDIPRATQMILHGTPRRIALGLAISPEGKFPPRYFLAIGGAGPDGALMAAVDVQVKLRLGILAYWLEGFRQLVRYPFPKFRVVSGEREEEATLVVVGRTKHYGGPFLLTTGADLREDSFELLTYAAASPWCYLAALPALIAGKVRRLGQVRYWKADSARCEPLDGERVFAQVDGEPIGELPMEFRIVPDALTLVFPESAAPQLS